MVFLYISLMINGVEHLARAYLPFGYVLWRNNYSILGLFFFFFNWCNLLFYFYFYFYIFGVPRFIVIYHILCPLKFSFKMTKPGVSV